MLPKSLVLFLLLSLSSFSSVESWGKIGHEVVANVAWRLITNHTRSVLREILNVTCSCNDSPLGDIANWADAVKYNHNYLWSKDLHYIDIQDDTIPGGCPVTNDTTAASSCSFEYARDCANDECVAGAIVNYTTQLVSRPSSTTTNESLKFLVHFVGDIHQPLHCSRKTDYGGNAIQVHFLDHQQQTTTTASTPSFYLRNRLQQTVYDHSHEHHLNLHAVWDDTLIEEYLKRDFSNLQTKLQDHLYSYIAQEYLVRTDWLSCPDGSRKICTHAWGQESLEYALAYAYRNVNGSEIVSGTRLEEEYYESRIGIVQERLAAAAVRLATTLEIVFSGGGGGRRLLRL